jgi:DNA-binding Lrp family transcriptional regulator
MSTATLDSIDTQLLNLLQDSFPLVDRPFLALAEKLGVSEQEVIDRVVQLKTGEKKIIRQISAIFDSASIGYQSTLVAAKIDPDRLEEAAAVISQHPGVSHNYKREHAFNLWYTVTVGPDSVLGLERTLEILHAKSGAISTRMLPAIRVYKIGVKFDVSGESDLTATKETELKRTADARHVLSDLDKSLIRVLQRDLPIESHPFEVLARASGVSVEQLLTAAQRYLDIGWMRRFSAVLRHRSAGFGANAMTAWAVPAEKCDEFGALAATFTGVSHCYRRPTFDDWRYSLFTMIHGQTKEQCESVIAALKEKSGVTDYAILYSTKEFKKIRVQYFTPEIGRWEAGQSANEK